MGHLDVNAVCFSLPDGQAAAARRHLPGGGGRQGRAHRPQRHRQDHAAADHRRRPRGLRRRRDPQRRPGRHAPVHRQGPRRHARCATCSSRSRPTAVRRAALEVDRTELRDDGARDRAGPAATTRRRSPTGATSAATSRRRSGTSCTVAALGMPFDRAQWRAGHDAVRRGAEAARARGAAARARRGAAARRAGQLPRRADQALARGAARRVAQDGAVRQPRPRAARPGGHPHRDARAEPRRQHGVGAPRSVRDVRRGPGRPQRPARGAAQALGRGARQAQGAGDHVPPEGGLQRRHGLALPGRPDPAAASSRRPDRPRRCRCARR